MITLKEARHFARDLIVDGNSEYHKIDEDDKGKLAGLIMKATPKSQIWEYITEADYKDDLPELLTQYLETGDNEIGLEILNKLKGNAIRYAARESMEILEEQLQEYNYYMNNEHFEE